MLICSYRTLIYSYKCATLCFLSVSNSFGLNLFKCSLFTDILITRECNELFGSVEAVRLGLRGENKLSRHNTVHKSHCFIWFC